MKRKLSRLDKKTFANEFISNGKNATQAYKAIRPEIKPNSAQVRGHKLLNDVIVRAELDEILNKQGITSEYIIKSYKTALEAGLARKATNKDALIAIKELAKLSGIDKETDLDPLQRADLEGLSHQELLKRLDQISSQVRDIKVGGAIEGEVVGTKP